MCLQGVTKVGSGVCKITLGSNWYLGTSGVCNSNGVGVTTSATTGYASTQLLACILTATFSVPINAVVLMNPGSSAGDASRATSCSAGGSGGMASWTPGVGRSLVAADALKVATSPYYVQSSGTSTSHSHSASGLTVTLSDSKITTGCGTTNANTGTFTLSGSTAATSDILPTTSAVVCSATTDAASTLPAGARVYFAAASCPGGFVAVASTVNGRLIYSLPSGGSNGATFGSTNTLSGVTSGSGPDAHSHSGWTTAPQVKSSSTGQFSGGISQNIVSGSSSTLTWTANSGYATAATGAATPDLPYVGLLLCEATTMAPSKAPSAAPTSQPTAQPTSQPTAQPTSHPSAQPTSLPSKQPSKAPSSPTQQPSPLPTRPGETSFPSKAPSSAPTSKAPSASPSSAPSSQPTKQPTAPTPAPTGRPTAPGETLSPTAAPTAAPSTAPTGQPFYQPTTAGPTTAGPTSASPTTAPPTSSPTLRDSSVTGSPTPLGPGSESSSGSLTVIVAGAAGGLVALGVLSAVLVRAARRSRGAGAGAGAGSGRVDLDVVRESLNPTFKAYPNDLAQHGVGVPVGGMGGSGAGSSMGAMGASFSGMGDMGANMGGSGASSFGNCKARFPFRADAADELSCTAGDRLELVNALDRDWALCRNERGQQGIVPLNVIVKDA
jgi:hypothetical protein